MRGGERFPAEQCNDVLSEDRGGGCYRVAFGGKEIASENGGGRGSY